VPGLLAIVRALTLIFALIIAKKIENWVDQTTHHRIRIDHGLAYFAADLISQGFTGKSISENVESWISK